MLLFRPRRPRGFHIDRTFAGNRRNDGKADRSRTDGNAAPQNDGGDSGARLRGTFIGATRHARRRMERRMTGGFVLSYGIITVLLLLLFAIWKMLLTA